MLRIKAFGKTSLLYSTGYPCCFGGLVDLIIAAIETALKKAISDGKYKRYFLLSPALTDELQGSVWPPYLPPYWFEFPSLALCSADFHQLHSEIFPKFPALTPVRTIPRLPAKRLYTGVWISELVFTQITQTAVALDWVASLPPAVDYLSALLPRVTISA